MLRPLMLGKGTDGDKRLSEPGRNQKVEPKRHSEAEDDDRHNHDKADGMQKPRLADRLVAGNHLLDIVDDEADGGKPWSEEETSHHGVVDPEQLLQPARQFFMHP